MTSPDFKAAAIIVTFHPDVSALGRLIHLLAPQVNRIFIVDNTPGGFTLQKVFRTVPYVTLLSLNENLGVAVAHNRGIETAKREGFTHVLLMDQDSVPAPDMVGVLREYLYELERTGLKIGAIGPLLVDAVDERPRGFVSTRSGRYVRVRSPGTSWVRCDYLATSGTLIPVNVFNEVGPLEEKLFIDGVDIEWGYRASTNGFASIGVFEARMTHTKGERILQFPGFKQNLYAPVRHYYAFRNFFALGRRSYVSPVWKRHVLLTSPLYALILATLIAPRLQNAKMIVRGVAHGISRRAGPIS